MRTLLTFAACACLAAAARGDDKPKPTALTPQEVADGWVSLFDGETTFGWTVDGDVAVKDGTLVVGGGGKPGTLTLNARFGAYDLRLESGGVAQIDLKTDTDTVGIGLTAQPAVVELKSRPGRGGISQSMVVGPGGVARIDATAKANASARLVISAGTGTGAFKLKSIKLRPADATPIFNGKDLSGWKVFAGDAKRAASKWAVTPAGELHVVNGPGDLQTDGKYGDFALQLEVKTNGKWLNSGVFFRCVPDQYQNGYEMQVQNGWMGDRTKPVDFGTGAIYRRVPARKVVSDDNEWFAMTLLARGPHIATWVNGVQVLDWTDTRPADDNPRKGLRTAPGHLSIQGHDPTTDILFRNLRVAEIK